MQRTTLSIVEMIDDRDVSTIKISMVSSDAKKNEFIQKSGANEFREIMVMISLALGHLAASGSKMSSQFKVDDFLQTLTETVKDLLEMKE